MLSVHSCACVCTHAWRFALILCFEERLERLQEAPRASRKCPERPNLHAQVVLTHLAEGSTNYTVLCSKSFFCPANQPERFFCLLICLGLAGFANSVPFLHVVQELLAQSGNHMSEVKHSLVDRSFKVCSFTTPCRHHKELDMTKVGSGLPDNVPARISSIGCEQFLWAPRRLTAKHQQWAKEECCNVCGAQKPWMFPSGINMLLAPMLPYIRHLGYSESAGQGPRPAVFSSRQGSQDSVISQHKRVWANCHWAM